MWAYSRSSFPTPANQMQFLWHLLAFLQNPLPFHCSLPLHPPPAGSLCITHRTSKMGAVRTIAGRLQDFLIMMWANCGNCFLTPANQMQFLWHNLAFIQNPLPFRCSLPPPPPPAGEFSMYHTQNFQKRAQYKGHTVFGHDGSVQATWSNYMIWNTWT